ncbi:MAG: sulfite exporter TauE/SafE family protein [Thermoplasmata archaeon]
MIDLTLLQYFLSVISGFIVGLTLGLIGGGGSILAVPLLLYLVGLIYDAKTASSLNFVQHLVIGTTAMAVGLNAYINSYMHFRKKNIKIKKGVVFTIPGVAGSFLGAYVGHIVNGTSLLFLFGILMIIVAYSMLRQKRSDNAIPTEGCRINFPILIIAGLGVGFLSGFFGIGGGFLIVPALMFAGGLGITNAVGTSLMAVGTFGVVSGLTYLHYGEVNIMITILYLSGGVFGGYIGTRFSTSMPKKKLRIIYAVVIILVAIYLIYKNMGGIGHFF